MPTDLTVAIARKAKAKHDSEAEIMIACVWLTLYFVMLVGSLAEPAFARALELAGLY